MSEPGGSAPHQNRPVVHDDGTTIRLFVYPFGVTEPLAVCELSPEAAVQLCADLASAAARHFALQRNHRIGVRRQP